VSSAKLCMQTDALFDCLHRTVTSYCQAVCVGLLDLLMLKCGILLVPGIVLSTGHIQCSTSIISFSVFFNVSLFI